MNVVRGLIYICSSDSSRYNSYLFETTTSFCTRYVVRISDSKSFNRITFVEERDGWERDSERYSRFFYLDDVLKHIVLDYIGHVVVTARVRPKDGRIRRFFQLLCPHFRFTTPLSVECSNVYGVTSSQSRCWVKIHENMRPSCHLGDPHRS